MTSQRSSSNSKAVMYRLPQSGQGRILNVKNPRIPCVIWVLFSCLIHFKMIAIDFKKKKYLGEMHAK